MKKTYALGLFCLGAACAQQAAPPPPATATWDDAAAGEIRAASTQMIEAFNKGDVPAVKGMLAHDSMTTSLDFDLENKPVVLSPGGVEAYLDKIGAQITEMMKAGGKFEQRASNVDCKATATMGWCFMTMEGKGTMPGGQPFSQTGWGTAVYRKGADGWKVSHWHATLAPPPAAALAPTVANAKDLKWNDIPGTGVKMATLFENPATSMHAFVDEFPKNFNFPAHMHSANYWMYVAKGQWIHTPKGGAPRVTDAGGFEFGPAREVHTTGAGKAGATVFFVTDGPFDLLDEQGKPLPPPPAAAPAAKKK